MRKHWPNQEGLMHATWTRIEVFRELRQDHHQHLEAIEDLMLNTPSLFETLVFFYQRPHKPSTWFSQSELMMITKLIVEQEQETEQALALLSSLTTILATAIKQYQVGTLLKNTARLASVVEWRCATQATTDNYITFAEQVDEIARLPTSKDGNMTISSYIMRSIACRAYAASEDIHTMRQRLDELLHTLEQWPFGYSDLLDLLATQMMPLLALWPSSHDITDGFQLATTAVLNAFETHNHSQIMETAYLIDTLLLCAKQRDQQVMAFEECLRWPMTLYPQHLPFALPA